MVALVSVIRRLNRAFDEEGIAAFATNRGAFAQGQALNIRLLPGLPDPLATAFQTYLDSMPGGVRETLRSVIYYALGDPLVPITFAWAPAYDTGITVWEPPCGITVLFQSRYPPGDARAEQMRNGQV